jgi:hypothetical protein
MWHLSASFVNQEGGNLARESLATQLGDEGFHRIGDSKNLDIGQVLQTDRLRSDGTVTLLIRLRDLLFGLGQINGNLLCVLVGFLRANQPVEALNGLENVPRLFGNSY